jgi:hypothetical protein
MHVAMIAVGVGMHHARRHPRQEDTQSQQAQQSAEAD